MAAVTRGRRGFRAAIAAAGLLAAWLAGPCARAAGGHHSVDDAVLLVPGACNLEGWATGSQDGARLLHGGGGCRVGPVELSAASELTRQGDASDTNWQLQLKWAHPLAAGVSAGFSVTPFWLAHQQPHFQGTMVATLLTWKANDSLTAHLNLGRDFLQNAPNQPRSGIALEWAESKQLSLLGERYVEDRTQFLRAGLRWSIGDHVTIDASRSQRLGGAGVSNWILGMSRQFDIR